MTTAVMPNARPKRQLSDELDRLDEQLQRHDVILDALSEHLTAAVTDAARQGTEAAVKAAVVALLTDPDLRQDLHTASPPPREDKPTAWQRLTTVVRGAAVRVTKAARATAAAVALRAVRGVAAIRRAAVRVRDGVRVRAVIKVLVGGLTVAALARAATAPRVAGLVDRTRTILSNQSVAAWEWLRGVRLLSAAA
jgi:hypothetical protein